MSLINKLRGAPSLLQAVQRDHSLACLLACFSCQSAVCRASGPPSLFARWVLGTQTQADMLASGEVDCPANPVVKQLAGRSNDQTAEDRRTCWSFCRELAKPDNSNRTLPRTFPGISTSGETWDLRKPTAFEVSRKAVEDPRAKKKLQNKSLH